jgi:hypothetical protein
VPLIAFTGGKKGSFGTETGREAGNVGNSGTIVPELALVQEKCRFTTVLRGFVPGDEFTNAA